MTGDPALRARVLIAAMRFARARERVRRSPIQTRATVGEIPHALRAMLRPRSGDL